jgi:hypothetical protein
MDENNVFNSGLNIEDWRKLCRAIMCASSNERENYDSLPKHLKSHEVGLLVREALLEPGECSMESRNLDRAAKLMVDGSESAWLCLSKS